MQSMLYGQGSKASFAAMSFSIDDKWYEQKTEMLSEALQELLTDGDAAKAKQGLIDAIASWTSYHEEELAKWNRLKALLGL